MAENFKQTVFKNNKSFISRALAQATLPYRDNNCNEIYSRTSTTSSITLQVIPKSEYNMPFGNIPRLILAFICTETIRTRNRTVSLGSSQNDFLRKLSLPVNDGRLISRIKEQCMRLFHASIVIEKNIIMWQPFVVKEPIWTNKIILSEEFFAHVHKHSVPFNLYIYHALKKSPLSMDIYIWLVYRMFLLSKSKRSEVIIPWPSLRKQFGSGIQENKNGIRKFKSEFLKRLKEVLKFYQEAKEHVQDAGKHLKLTTCTLHIPVSKKNTTENDEGSQIDQVLNIKNWVKKTHGERIYTIFKNAGILSTDALASYMLNFSSSEYIKEKFSEFFKAGLLSRCPDDKSNYGIFYEFLDAGFNKKEKTKEYEQKLSINKEMYDLKNF